tara:strand:- start:579 stop:692 length:114 start_codon:yes stop_codon:yes gene_type:complete
LKYLYVEALLYLLQLALVVHLDLVVELQVEKVVIQIL